MGRRGGEAGARNTAAFSLDLATLARFQRTYRSNKKVAISVKPALPIECKKRTYTLHLDL